MYSRCVVEPVDTRRGSGFILISNWVPSLQPLQIERFQPGAEFVVVHVPSLWVPSLQGAEVVGAEFERCRSVRYS